MGKNNTIASLSNIIGGMVAHKILLKYTNKPETKNHLEGEVKNYGNSAFDLASQYNWNQEDKERIKQESFSAFKKELKNPHFTGIIFPMNDAELILDETLKNIFDEEIN
jgi:hypothetical protein